MGSIFSYAIYWIYASIDWTIQNAFLNHSYSFEFIWLDSKIFFGYFIWEIEVLKWVVMSVWFSYNTLQKCPCVFTKYWSLKHDQESFHIPLFHTMKLQVFWRIHQSHKHFTWIPWIYEAWDIFKLDAIIKGYHSDH